MVLRDDRSISKKTFLPTLLCIYMLQALTLGQRLNRLTCERRPTHTQALKTPGDNGFSIKILGTPPPEYYEPGKDYQVFINGSYMNQQFLDFMLVAVKKGATSERDTAGTFTHLLSHMTQEDENCNHVMTSVTFHPSYKKSSARFTWTAPRKGTGCIIFKGTVVEHPDIWYSDDGGLTKMLCEKPDSPSTSDSTGKTDNHNSNPSQSNKPTHSSDDSATSKRGSSKCCACDVAKYEMTFHGNWSRESHPNQFPTKEYESLLHWSDIIGASHSPGYSIWSYDTLASNGVKEVCEYGWPRTLEGEIKQQGRNVRTVIKTSGIWGYPALYTSKRNARFSTDNERPFVSMLTMVGPSPDWCVGMDSINLCLEDCSWVDKLDVNLYPWDAGTDSGVTYLSKNLPTYPREKIRPITNEFPNNTASPFYGSERVKPMGTLSIRRIGSRHPEAANKRCEAKGATQGDDSSVTSPDSDENTGVNGVNPKCMTTEWSEFTACSVTCGVGVKTRSRQFKHPMGSVKMCPYTKINEVANCLGLVNECDVDPNEPVDICVTTQWSDWSRCSVTCGKGSRTRTRLYMNSMGPFKCSQLLTDSEECSADIPDCSKAAMMVDWLSVCSLPAEKGRCVGYFNRFFYDSTMGKCRPFQYGGCRGNQNRFDTMDECERTCGQVMANKKETNEPGSDGEGAAADRDCMVTEWTEFSECSVSCGRGSKSRSRMIKVRNTGKGAPCPKELYETRVCASMCPKGSAVSAGSSSDVDCMLSEWRDWSDCSLTCGTGVQVRQRMIKRPAQGQGQPCRGDLKEMRECNPGVCSADDYSLCMLTEWTDWSECSEQCGLGKMMRQRMQKRGPCSPDTVYTQTKQCEGTTCPAASALDCVVGRWSDWTICNRPCGMGVQSRMRFITRSAQPGGRCELREPKQMEMRSCYLQSCDKMTLALTTPAVAVDCQVSGWGPWTTCSRTCGIGKQLRHRTVLVRRQNGGKRCPPLKQRRRCQTGIRCRRRRLRH